MMNPGPVEEGAKVATTFVDALKTQPVMLGMVFILAAMIGLLFFVAYKGAETRQHELDRFYEMQKETQLLLAKCVLISPEELLHSREQKPPKEYHLQSDETKGVKDGDTNQEGSGHQPP